MNEEYVSNNKQIYKGKRTKKKFLTKIFFTKEDNNSSDEDGVSESDT
jgi:hypothetical protein